MKAPMTPTQAREIVEFEMGRNCVVQGFDQREFGSQMVTVLYYAFVDVTRVKHPLPRYRVQVFVDHERVAAAEVDR